MLDDNQNLLINDSNSFLKLPYQSECKIDANASHLLNAFSRFLFKLKLL
jgi:hypothetical protein